MNEQVSADKVFLSCARIERGAKDVQRIRVAWLGLVLALAAFSGCGHHVEVAPWSAPQATPPPIASRPPQVSSPAPQSTTPARIAPTPAPPGGVSAEDLDFIESHKPILIEEGLATWYTATKGRKSANGQLFDDHSLTAAHRTLPMGSLIVVTNIETGESSPMRITDRGPFVEGRLLDLTIASAKATGVYRAGLVNVRVEVYRTPKPIESGGRWCVQIGAFTSQRKANQLKSKLQRKYPDANVIEFPGEDSYWVRIRPSGDDRKQAQSVARHLRPAQGSAFLTRLD
jgi:rare lipoprotein A